MANIYLEEQSRAFGLRFLELFPRESCRPCRILVAVRRFGDPRPSEPIRCLVMHLHWIIYNYCQGIEIFIPANLLNNEFRIAKMS